MKNEKKKWVKPEITFHPLPPGMELNPDDPELETKLKEIYEAGKDAENSKTNSGG